MTATHKESELWRLAETLALIGAGLAAMGGGIMWATAEVAGRLFGRGSPQLGFDDAVAALAKWPSAAGAPRAAFPSNAVELPSDSLSLYLSLCLVCGVAALVVTIGLRVWKATSRKDTGSRLAQPNDLRGLLHDKAVPGRITVGRLGRRLVVMEARHSLLVIGPPQTGKTTGLAIPAILEWPGPVLVTSSKTDVLEDTRRARALRGDVMVYYPTGDTDGSVGGHP